MPRRTPNAQAATCTGPTTNAADEHCRISTTRNQPMNKPQQAQQALNPRLSSEPRAERTPATATGSDT
eukprot:5318827-Alexandrium_andersonii.AAC.1